MLTDQNNNNNNNNNDNNNNNNNDNNNNNINSYNFNDTLKNNDDENETDVNNRNTKINFNEIQNLTDYMANMNLVSDEDGHPNINEYAYSNNIDYENDPNKDDLDLQPFLDKINDIKYMLDCHPVLYFLLVIVKSIKENQYPIFYQELKRFLQDKGLLEGEVNMEVPLYNLNQLIFRCYDIIPEKLINMAKVFTIKTCYHCNKKCLNKNVIINCYIIYQLGCLVFDEHWYKFEYTKHGWTKTSELEIVQDINIFFPMNLDALCKQVKLSLDGFTNYISQYLCSNFICVRDIEHLNNVLILRNFKWKIDKSPVLRFNDCVYDFKIRDTRSGRPSDFCVKGTGYNFYSEDNNEETRNLVMQFFKDVFVEQDLIDYVLKVLASTLTLGNKLRSLVFFIGSGSNGKTTLGNMMKYAMGDYAATPSVSLFLGQSVSADNPNPHMYELNNTRVAICEEPDPKSVTITGDAKAISGNVGIMKSRTLYRNLEFIYVDLLPIINTNLKMTITNIDTALIDRIIVIPFLQRFLPEYKKEKEERDGDTHVRMAQPMWQGRHTQRFAPAFIHLLLDYYQDDYTKIEIPAVVKKHTEEFILKCDHVGRFIKLKLEDVFEGKDKEEEEEKEEKDNDNKEMNSDHILCLEDVYALYRKWYKSYVKTSNLKYTVTEFRIDLKKYGIRLLKGHLIKNSTFPENDYLIGYRLK